MDLRVPVTGLAHMRPIALATRRLPVISTLPQLPLQYARDSNIQTVPGRCRGHMAGQQPVAQHHASQANTRGHADLEETASEPQRSSPSDPVQAFDSDALTSSPQQSRMMEAATSDKPPGTTLPAPAWGALALLSLSYMHQASNSFSLPVMLPAISSELHLDDLQGALLTTGYSYLYAMVLLPVGMLCDRLPRPKLLAAGVATWSTLTLLASNAHNFGELMAARIGFAAAQAVQNPIAFALIPELFPSNKSAALSIYNCAIYLGRALSFAAALAGAQLARLGALTAVAAGSASSSGAAVAAASTASAMGVASAAPLIFVPLDKLDLRLVSIVYTRGDYAAVMPTFSYTTFGSALEDLSAMDPAAATTEAVKVVLEATGASSWRDVLHWIAAPGFVIALALALALPEPRQDAGKGKGAAVAGAATVPQGPSRVLATATHSQQSGREGPASAGMKTQQQTQHLPRQQEPPQAHASVQAVDGSGTKPAGLLLLLREPAFICTALAASFNDVASYALVAWQSTFYERVHHLTSAEYAPILAAILPIGGIVGGVGGGWVADWAARTDRAREAKQGISNAEDLQDGAGLSAALSGRGTKGRRRRQKRPLSGRAWVTVGASAAASPLLLVSMLAPDPHYSYVALLIGFALSEGWRAPAANMARSVAPPEMGSTASALYLCIRNLVGGAGPLSVALLSVQLGGDLQHALLLVPTMYLASGMMFWVAERQFAEGERT